MTFKDRTDAAERLTQQLKKFSDRDAIVLGMARGGVILAKEIAQTIGAEMDVLVVRKIGAPRNPEYGVGAVAPDGKPVFDKSALYMLGLGESDLQPTVWSETQEIYRRLKTYRQGMLPLEVANRTVILVDDGLATGVTALAAARYIKSLGASYLIFAAPVCSQPGVRMLEEEVDEVICLLAPAVFQAVGLWYEDFSQVEDNEVIRAMDFARRREYLA